MMNDECRFEHDISSVAQLSTLLASVGTKGALLKLLPKNANDKNQVYIGADFNILHPTFALTFNERGHSESQTKRNSDPNKRIPEAVFDSFHWLTNNGEQIPAKNVKAIFYAQYPEARLSGFQTVENTMPRCLSVEYTKQALVPTRLLILAQLPSGKAVGILVVQPKQSFIDEISTLPGFNGSRICKHLQVENDGTQKLEVMLSKILGRTFDGCRYDKEGNTIPFKGTQVCGYTLEHACGIVPNSDKDGDIFGIELKTHTQKKLTLFTPEPDFGDYKEDFNAFMRKYGYQDKEGNWRLTGVHKANVMCVKSGLTLKVRVKKYVKKSKEWVEIDYDPMTSSSSKMDYFEVVLEDNNGHIAAGWSHERLMNCWGSKHNEVVYIPSSKATNPDIEKRNEGYEYAVSFSEQVMWCGKTNADRLFKAIYNGTVFLDPAPKLHTTDPSKSKRRSQWRVNDIAKAAKDLYESVEFKKLA